MTGSSVERRERTRSNLSAALLSVSGKQVSVEVMVNDTELCPARLAISDEATPARASSATSVRSGRGDLAAQARPPIKNHLSAAQRAFTVTSRARNDGSGVAARASGGEHRGGTAGPSGCAAVPDWRGIVSVSGSNLNHPLCARADAETARQAGRTLCL
jgi:hypothetical protein